MTCASRTRPPAGDHFNPERHPPGLPEGEGRHAGDLGNIEADGGGRAVCDRTIEGAALEGPRSIIIGRAIIVHEKLDTGGRPTGEAGGRVGIGVMGIANPEE